jgi:hypothetical protein
MSASNHKEKIPQGLQITPISGENRAALKGRA